MTQPAALPGNEKARMARLRMLQILDSDPEVMFDSLTRLASEVFEVPIALVSLVDTGRQWFKANVGLAGVSETPRDIAFCSHAILQTGIMEVHDARLDERFAANPLVTGSPGIRFYAGAPIILSDASRLGTFCILDRVPRKLSAHQRTMLTHMAGAVSHAIEAREVSMNAMTTKIRLEEDLLLAARRSDVLRATIDACPIAVTIADMTIPGSALIYANESFSKLTGYATNDAIGQNCRFLQGPETDRELARRLGRAIAAAEQIEVEIVNYRKDGTKFLNRLIMAPVHDKTGMLTAFVGLQSDVTLAAQRRDAIEHQREKMAALGRAMGGVAHEINNMLQPVALLVQETIDNHMVTAEGAAHMEIVLNCTRNIRHIIGDLLAFCRPASRSEEIREFVTSFREILPIAIQGLPKTVVLNLCIECKPLLIKINQTKFSQILVNLVSNAVAAMAGAGKLTIELDEAALSPLSVAQRAARLRIRDNGCGMDVVTLERAFEPFFTTKPIGEGTGLGLPMVYGLVQELGGIIKLESAAGEGTMITILIPIAEPS